MKVLVTGSDGYIGIRLGEVLLDAGHEVCGLDTGYYRSGWLYNGVARFPLAITKDIRQVTKDDLSGFDAIVHLAELSNDPLGQNDPLVTFDINHRGTVGLATCAKEGGVGRFIYFSSCSVYGASDQISSEASPTNPLTAYAKCKVLNEQMLGKLADDTFSPTILRNSTVFGPSPRMRFDLVVNDLAAKAWTSKEIKMDSDGTPWRPFVHILDVCEATKCVLEATRDSVHNQVFNVGSDRSNYQIKDVAEIVARVFPGCIVSLNKEGADRRNYRVNFDKISTLVPGFSCRREIETGAKELLEVFKRINLTKELHEAKEYTRLKQVKYLSDSGQLDKNFFWK